MAQVQPLIRKLVGTPRYAIKTYEQAGRPLTDGMKRFRNDWLASKALR